MKSKLILGAKIIVTVLLFGYLFRKIDPHRFYETLKSADVFPLILACLVLLATHVTCAIRWRVFLDLFGLRFPFLRLVYVYAVGLFFNLALPTGVGGDLVKFYLTGKETNGSYTLAFASVFLDRDVGLVAIAFAATFFCIFQPISIGGHALLPWLLIITGGLVMVNVVLFNQYLHRIISRLLVRFPTVAWRVDVISDALVTTWQHKIGLANTFALSLINDILMGVMGWLIAKSLHIALPLMYFLVLIPTISLITMIPVAPGGMGLRENAFQILFTALGVDPEKSILMGFLTSFIMIILPSLPGGLICLFFKKRGSMKGIEEASEAIARSKLPLS